jgi:hypothetical protein
MFKDYKYYKNNLLHRIADNLDTEINQYFIDILNGDKKLEGIDVTKIRWKLFKDFHEDIINNINKSTQKENDKLTIQLREALNKSRFSLSDDQEEKLKQWKETHECKHRNKSQGAIGGQYTYEFVPTSIGVFCSVKCSCGKSINISDI